VGSGWDLFDFDRPRRERIIAQYGPEAAVWIRSWIRSHYGWTLANVAAL